MTTQTTELCMMSGDGAGAMARIVHNGRRNPPAVAFVHGLVRRPLPACEYCAAACRKDGYKVETIYVEELGHKGRSWTGR